MKTHMLICLVAAACVRLPASATVDTDTDTEAGSDSDSSDASGGTTLAGSEGETEDGSTTSAMTTSSADSTTGGADGSSTCGTECTAGQPELQWIVEPEIELDGGRCLGVVADGQGGAVASLVTAPESPLAGGVVLALSDAGDELAQLELEQRQVEGMERVGAGEFWWVDSSGWAGASTSALDDLEGAPLVGDIWAADDLARVDGGTAYAIVTGTLFAECRVRMSGRSAIDSDPIGCGEASDRWRLEAHGGDVVGGLVGQSALVRVDADGQVVAALPSRYQRTLFDIAVADDGSVWTVGAIGNPHEAGPTFGSFVARHDPSLAEDPQWEGLEEGDTSPVWTAVVLRDGAPILVGRDDDDVARIAALTPSGDASWSLELDLPPSVLLRHADIDADGTLVVCGDRLTAEAPAQSSPVLVSVAVP